MHAFLWSTYMYHSSKLFFFYLFTNLTLEQFYLIYKHLKNIPDFFLKVNNIRTNKVDLLFSYKLEPVLLVSGKW